MNNKKLEEVLHDLNTLGYHKTNIVDLLGNEGIDNFNKTSEFFEEMLNDSKIRHRLETIKQGINLVNSNKYFEITHYEYLNRALSITDGGLINIYLDDFFIELAKKFLKTDTPELYNVMAFIHGQCLAQRTASQNWHRDLEDFKILKIFTYFTNVTKETGALEYVPFSYCGGDFPLNKGYTTYQDYKKIRILNQELEEQYCTPNAVTFEGSIGDIIITNNTGYHRGGFVQSGFRCMGHALYVRPDAISKPSNFNYDKEINFIDTNSIEYKKLNEKQKHIKL